MGLPFWSLLFTGTAGAVAELTLDPQLKYWVLLPISMVMMLAGVLRQYIMVLIGPKPKGIARVKLTESQWITKAQLLMGNGSNLSKESFEQRKEYLSKVMADGKYVAQTNNTAQGPQNPFTDPNMSEQMMSMAKGNLANFIPQTLIMWWVNHFFAGFVLMKLPFPLTPRFKEMLQNGIATPDLDVRWVSSISWYFISVLGLNPVYNLLLSEPQDAMLQSGQVPVFNGNDSPSEQQALAAMKGLANDLIISMHRSVFDTIEQRVLDKYSVPNK